MAQLVQQNLEFIVIFRLNTIHMFLRTTTSCLDMSHRFWLSEKAKANKSGEWKTLTAYIFWLEVSVDDAHRVQMFNSQYDFGQVEAK